MIRSAYLPLIIAAALVTGGCNKAESVAGNNANVATSANAAATATPARDTAANTANEPGNVAGTPTEVYKAAYMARKNCDVAALKKIMSKDIQKFLTEMGKSDKKSLDDELKDICSHPQGSSQQVRNEKIDGDRASVEYMDEEGGWQRMDFVKEDGAWKMSMGKGDEDFPPDDAPGNKNSNR